VSDGLLPRQLLELLLLRHAHPDKDQPGIMLNARTHRFDYVVRVFLAVFLDKFPALKKESEPLRDSFFAGAGGVSPLAPAGCAEIRAGVLDEHLGVPFPVAEEKRYAVVGSWRDDRGVARDEPGDAVVAQPVDQDYCLVAAGLRFVNRRLHSLQHARAAEVVQPFREKRHIKRMW